VVPQSYVLGPRDGEHLILRGGDIFINADPSKGFNGLATGTQQVPVGVGIPIHRHLEMEEAFYVLEGSGTFTPRVNKFRDDLLANLSRVHVPKRFSPVSSHS
jgi:hypothetical protein